ncbi:hypothetical protein [Nostoc sp. 'Peltigera malacea cyanobiont' DB3992]|uniref:hypothetical protein n=1 Tax=Nostoc sp. 'Peltigera malacea cyanobiont' DB3992 TaxID=1206980 RepID=UPI0015D521A4|nr:hypothetical protein [Nostoc sp. 'Peltigera malacea cyanobiont' DB3992]
MDFDNLLLSGCNLLNNYLITHPEVLEELQSCQTRSRLVQAATVLVIQGEKLARNDDINGAVEKFGKAQQWDNKLKFDSQTRARELAQGKTDLTPSPFPAKGKGSKKVSKIQSLSPLRREVWREVKGVASKRELL